MAPLAAHAVAAVLGFTAGLVVAMVAWARAYNRGLDDGRSEILARMADSSDPELAVRWLIEAEGLPDHPDEPATWGAPEDLR